MSSPAKDFLFDSQIAIKSWFLVKPLLSQMMALERRWQLSLSLGHIKLALGHTDGWLGWLLKA